MAQHDYVINNQGFPAFRSDLNNALDSVKTSNSGSTAPSTTAQGQIFVDTGTSGKIIIKFNYNGTAFSTIAEINTSSGVVTIPSGVQVNASITESDPNAIPFAVALGS
tara:strand:+ start:200 stop:523 length:324 start_codon:yes stop_codon:yes gene_type:complete